MSFFNEIKNQYKYNDVSQKIIFWNVGIFIVSIFFFYGFKTGVFQIPEYCSLSSIGFDALKFPWTLITYAFLHAGLMHLLFNMLMLHFTARLFFTFFNNKQFLFTYLFGAVFSGVCFVILTKILYQENVLVGASAAIISVLFTVVFYSPFMNVRLLLIGNVKLWHIGLFFILSYVLSVGIENTGGHISHLAAIAFGFINYKLLIKGVDISKWFTFKHKQKNNTFKKVYKNKTEPGQKNKNIKNINQKQIDDILDKISKSGYDSLSNQEKEFLFKINQ